MNWQQLLCSERRKDKEKEKISPSESSPILPPISKGRKEIERDYDRLLFSAPTRRLISL